jgi:hypothetical protein
MLIKLQRKLNLYPFYKFSKTKGDRLWYITSKQGAKVYIPFGIGITRDLSGEFNVVLYKLYLGPLVIYVGRKI